MPGRATERQQQEFFSGSWNASRRAPAGPLAASLCLHVLAISVLIRVDWGPDPRRFQAPTVEQLIAESGHTIIWYPRQMDLPAITPEEEAPPNSGEERARFRLPRQSIAANDPNPESGRQMIRGPAPEITVEQDVSSPNLLAWTPPDVRMPRFEMPSREETAPGRRALLAEQAPEIQAADSRRLDLAQVQPLRPLRYRTIEREQAAPSRNALEPDEAPRVEPTTTPGLDLERLRQRERLRYWAPEKRAAQPERSAIPDVDAPSVEARAGSRLELDKIQRLEPLRYWTPPAEAELPRRAALENGESAPEVEMTAPQASVTGPVSAPRLRYWPAARAETAPARKSLREDSDASPPPARGEPAVASRVASAGEMALAEAGRSLAGLNPPAPGSETGPGTQAAEKAGASGGPEAGSSNNGSAGGPAGVSGNSGPNLAVVGLDPSSTLESIPRGQRRGRFSASPDGGPGGGDSPGETATLAEVRIPHLSVSGAPAAPAYTIARPPVPEPLRGERDEAPGLDVLTRFRNPREYTQLPVPTTPPAEPLASPGESELMFADRAVYTMAVNMPNISSGAGSWIIRFAELDKAGGKKKPDEGKLSAPSPRLKVDPRYVRSAAEEGVEGKVVLYAVIREDGLVGDVRVVKSLDERLDESAVVAFSKWRFEPATNDRGPVNVEAVVEVPFRLARPAGDSR